MTSTTLSRTQNQTIAMTRVAANTETIENLITLRRDLEHQIITAPAAFVKTDWFADRVRAVETVNRQITSFQVANANLLTDAGLDD